MQPRPCWVLCSPLPRHVAVTLLQKIQTQPLPRDTLLNVNVPDVPLEQLQGYQVTRLGARHKAEAVVMA